jgi:hypothetical protein
MTDATSTASSSSAGNYKSAEKYVGSDGLELLVLFPNGFAWEIRYNIDVR